MATRNPTIDPPLFARPAHVYRSASPSPSPSQSRPSSPSRHSRNFSQSYDPLARDLSPTRTLKAFTSAPGTALGKNEAALARLIEKASSSERQFGIRIAQTCKDIRTWHDELQQWPWEDSFEPPSDIQDQEEGLYWGSLRHDTVISYEQRSQDIRDGLYDQDVDALKDYVLAQHSHPKPDDDYERLDDFTALITATILHALPYLSRLDSLLNTWTIRLAVLRKVPGYLRGLAQAKSELDKAWSDMAQHLHQSPGADALRQSFHAFQDQIEMKMGKLGGRLDSMLDDLEGREETLPDAWIDGFELLESSFSEWLSQTERHIHQQSLPPPRLPDKRAAAGVTTRELESATAASSDQEDINPSHAPPQIVLPADNQTDAQATTERSNSFDTFDASLQPAESPILGSSPAPFLNGGESDPDSDALSPDAMNVSHVPEPAVPAASNDGGLRRAGSLKLPSPTLTRSRHVPIVVNYEEDISAHPSPSEEPVVPEERVSSTTSRPSPPPDEPAPSITNSKVRARAAFLNGGLEQTQSLQKSVNSPVRPFEHASMAFTKLFSKANSAGHSRSSSTSSKSSARRGLGLGIKNHEGFRTFHRSNPSAASNKSEQASGNNSNTASPQLIASSPPPAPRHSSSPVRGTHAQPLPAAIKARDLGQVEEQTDRSGQAMYTTPELEQDFFPSTEESKSTIDINWSSPAMSDFPDNWPLPVQIVEDEISSPNAPMDSNLFEQMFVDSLPGTPHAKSRRVSHEENPLEKIFAQSSKPLGFKEPMLDDTMLAGNTRRRSKSGSAVGGSRPQHRSRPSISSLSTPIASISELPTPASFDATPELQDASTAGYFRAKQVRTPSDGVPSPFARSNSQQDNQGFEMYESQPSPISFNLNAPMPRNEEAVDSSQYEGDEQVFQARVPLIKRASVTSIENHSRSELNTIEIPDIPRRASLSTSPKSFKSHLPEPMHGRSLIAPPNLRTDSERSYAAGVLGASKPPPLNINMPKRRDVADAAPPSSPLEAKPSIPPIDPKRKKHMRKESGAEQLDRHVSRVLSSLPSRITFKSSLSEPSVEQSSASSAPANTLRPRPALVSKPSRSALTLSAVQPDPASKKSTAVDSDVRLYHLTQEGRDQPIKLFVRLVGEGERVMVRVGGGWADLGEYLRQYAEHHGHRTFSDGKLEVAAATAKGGSMRVGGGTKARTPLSRPGSVMDRPGSSMSVRTSRSSFGTGTMPFDMNSSPSSSSQADTSIPVNIPRGYHTPTGSVKSTSRPSTADTFSHASPSSWSGKDIGLAGPAAKRGGGLDEAKARWVEEMIGRAKMASSAEKKKDEKRAWEDMGKVGGTRRMVFKHQRQHGDEGSGSS